jgi:uncharacterized protein YciI
MTEASPVYVVLCTYGPEALSRREAAMADHLSYLRKNGYRLRFAGPTLADDGQTTSGSLAVVEVPDRDGAEEFIRGEAFHRAGMFDDVEITRFASDVDGRQVRITPDPEREIFLCRWTTADPTPVVGRAPNAAVGPARGRLLEGGALLTDDGSREVGGFFLVEVPDRSAAEEFVTEDVRRRSGPAAHVLVRRWRFGNALGGA